jgi:hypothetical protein
MMNIKLDSSQSDTYPFVRSVPISGTNPSPYRTPPAPPRRSPLDLVTGQSIPKQALEGLRAIAPAFA